MSDSVVTSNYQNPILTIVGPTAVGKTALAIQVAKQIGGEVIGLDSRQMYSGMEIGTAQPTQKEQAQIPHHLVGMKLPHQSVSAGEYAELVLGVIDDIRQRNHEPILCGGAGLYYRALTKGIFSGSKTKKDIRRTLELEYKNQWGDAMLNELKTIDPIYAEIVHPNNKKRLIRALEIYRSTGKSPSVHFNEQQSQPQKLELFTVLVKMEMDQLEERIRERTEAMFAAGWVGEVERLRNSSDETNIHPSDSIGYGQIKRHLDGEISYEEMLDEILVKTRQYAKKQLKWFLNEPVDFCVEMKDNLNLSETVLDILSLWNRPIKE